MENIIELLEKKGFEKFWNGQPKFEKVLVDNELALYFEEDTDTASDIESGAVKAAHIVIDTEANSATFALFDHVPSAQEISNASIYQDDWYSGSIEAIEKL